MKKHLRKENQTLDTIRVIVTLRMENFQPEGNLGSPQIVEQQREHILALQAKVLDALKPFSPKHVRRHQFTPKLTMIVDQSALEALYHNPHVQHVQKDLPSPPSVC